MSAAELALWVQLVICVALIIGMVILLLRRSPGLIDLRELTVQTQTLKSDLERIQRTIRDDNDRSVNSAEDRGKALRDEVWAALKAVGDDLRQSAGQAAELQHNQLDSFAQQLREGVKVLDQRMETLRLAVDQKTNHLIQTLVSKLDNAQETHAQQGKALREEVSASLKSVGDDLRLSAANAANVQRTQLEAFAIQLTEGLSGIDGRMEALRQIVDQKITALMEGISGRFDSAREASTAAGKALREEVQTTLKTVGDDLRMNAEVAATTQKDRLREVSTKIVELSEGIGQRFESFRRVTEAKLTEMRQDAGTAAKELREEVTNTLNKVGEDLRENAKRVAEEQRIALEGMSKRMSEIGEASQRGQEKLRESVAEGLMTLRRENDQKLEQMRQTVDEKLQGTLEKRLGESFNLVTQQLKQVHEGLGDMQKLATGVGDLKRVLTNVKSRGTWGETQLAAILEDMLAPNQYARNVRIKDGSNETVEFCVKIPLLDEHQENVLLPIDAKFPTEDYERLMTAAEAGDPAGTEQAAQKLETRFRACAKEIYMKYISPPRTTDYAVMYVPSEGLYAEIVKRPGLISAITREFTVVVAGPTNLTAILNAVHAVSRSVAIQHKAGEIAALLLKVQSEFVKYGEAVSTAKKRAVSTVKAMESLDTRQKAMGRALSGVSSIGGIAATVQLTGPVLDLAIDEIADDDSDDELLYMNEGDKIGELRNVD